MFAACFQLSVSSYGVFSCSAVRFSGDAKLPDPVATAIELGLESAKPSAAGEESDLQDVELGFLKPERKYEATICPVAEGTQLANVRESEGLTVEIIRAESGEGMVVACAFFTPREGDVTHFFSADFAIEFGVVKHRAFSIVGKVMTSDKGAPHQYICTTSHVSACLGRNLLKRTLGFLFAFSASKMCVWLQKCGICMYVTRMMIPSTCHITFSLMCAR